jgi:hypothetical protein
MRLSDAILLGSTVVTPRAGRLISSSTKEGCALGMAAVGLGCGFKAASEERAARDRRTANIEDVFGTWLGRVVMRTCECGPQLPREMRVKDVIAHVFDVHVMGKKDWTLAQLVEWVKRWEPQEPGWFDLIESDNDTRKDQTALSQASDLRDERSEWLSTREAFESKQQSKRKRRLGKG